MATDKPRYSITLDDEMFREVEDFRFENRYQTRNKATIELIRLGLEVIRSQQVQTEENQTDRQQAGEYQSSGTWKEEDPATPDQMRENLIG